MKGMEERKAVLVVSFWFFLKLFLSPLTLFRKTQKKYRRKKERERERKGKRERALRERELGGFLVFVVA